MKEKKLTDEKIIKAFEEVKSIADKEFERTGTPINFMKIPVDATLIEDTLDLIHRQKAEIERLTEEHKTVLNRSTMWKRLHTEVCEENAELQKQVDELKANKVIECHGMLKGCDMVKQAVKDTAKEILQWLKAEVIMTEIPHGSEPCEEDVEAVMWWQIEKHFKKKYGVEV